jgi:hypothetical protein
MPDLVFPVYVLAKDCGDVMEFSSLSAMQGYIEAVDVENDEYAAWDTTGRLLQLSVGKSNSGWLQLVTTNQKASEQEFAGLKRRSETYQVPEEPFFTRLLRRFGLGAKS